MKSIFSFLSRKKESDSNIFQSNIKVLPPAKDFHIFIVVSRRIIFKEKVEYPNVMLEELTDREDTSRIKDGWTCVRFNEYRGDYVYRKIADIHSVLKCIAIHFERACVESDYEDLLYNREWKTYYGIFHYEIPENIMEKIAEYCFNLGEDIGAEVELSSSSDLGKLIIQTVAQNIVQEENINVLQFKQSLTESLLSINKDSKDKRELEKLIYKKAKEVVTEYGIPNITFGGGYWHLYNIILENLLYSLRIINKKYF